MATHGGARPGAGRKKKAEKYAPRINAAEKKIADRLPDLVDNLLFLANGGYERVEEKFERVIARDEKGQIKRDANGVELYELVLIERKVETADKDRAANIYLLDRIMGKPTQPQEIDAQVGLAIPASVEALIEKIYGDSGEGDSGDSGPV